MVLQSMKKKQSGWRGSRHEGFTVKKCRTYHAVAIMAQFKS